MPSFRETGASGRPELPDSWASAAVALDPAQARALVSALEPELAFDTPSAGAWFGVGEALRLESSDEAPFSIVEQAERVLAGIQPVARTAELEPIFLGGFAFDAARTGRGDWRGFAPGRLVLPELLIHVRGARAWAMAIAPRSEAAGLLAALRIRIAETVAAEARAAGIATAVAPTVPRHEWDRAVEAALAEFDSGRLHKVVLARTLTAQLSAPVPVAPLLARLRRRFPDCFVYCARDGERAFVGATPELLFHREGRQLQTMALAGSIRRDPDPERDAALGAQLLADPKERREHAYVVEAIRESLAPHALELQTAEVALRRLANVQHLQTAIRAQLAPATSTRTLLEALHPTPAVCGTPRGPALELIRTVEAFERGWYAGPIGMVGAAGSTFAVALRCMLLQPCEARIFVGAGMVAGTDPEREWGETAAKSQAMLRALEEERP